MAVKCKSTPPPPPPLVVPPPTHCSRELEAFRHDGWEPHGGGETCFMKSFGGGVRRRLGCIVVRNNLKISSRHWVIFLGFD